MSRVWSPPLSLLRDHTTSAQRGTAHLAGGLFPLRRCLCSVRSITSQFCVGGISVPPLVKPKRPDELTSGSIAARQAEVGRESRTNNSPVHLIRQAPIPPPLSRERRFCALVASLTPHTRITDRQLQPNAFWSLIAESSFDGVRPYPRNACARHAAAPKYSLYSESGLR